MNQTRRWVWPLFALFHVACSPRVTPGPGPVPIERTGIDGCNCAGAAAVMNGPDGAAYPFLSVVAYYYQVLEAFWTKVDDDDVLQTWLPKSVEATSEAFYAWQAKSLQIYRDRDRLGFSHRYYRGIFGFLEGSGEDGTCTATLDDGSRLDGMLAHVGLSQASECGKNDDGTTKFWQVNNISLLKIGEVFDVDELIDAGLAYRVTSAPANRCILYGSDAVSIGGATGSATTDVGCAVAFRDDAVTEGVVLPVPSSAEVAGVPVQHRGFTAAGVVTMPNGLDEVRKILRDGELRAMFAIGVPQFTPEPYLGPTKVRLVGHAVGPAMNQNTWLLDDERAWVNGLVQIYADACCHEECTYALAGSGSGSGGTCQQVCIPEGVCTTNSASAGLVVMVASVTTRDCNGSCPAPASGAPAAEPSCAP